VIEPAYNSAMSGALHTRIFPARRAALRDVDAFLAGVGAAAGFPHEATLRLTLLVEELFTNTVVHGHGGDSDAPVRLECEVEAGRVALAYEDTGPAHDPFASVGRPDAAASVEERPVGGLGVLLVSAMAQQFEYRRAGDTNRVTLVVTAAGATS